MRVRLLTYLFIIILVSISVQAFGVSYQYMENNTIKLYPGQKYLFKLTVQNVDENEVTVNVSLNSAIAKLADDSILDVPGKTYDRYVVFEINVPEKAIPGDTSAVTYTVSQVGKGEGQIPLNVRYERGFIVLVVEKPKDLVEEQPALPQEKPGMPKWVFIPLIIIVVLAIITLLIIMMWRKSHQLSGRITSTELRIKHSEPAYHKAIIPEHKHVLQPEILPPLPKQEEHVREQKKAPKQEKIINTHHYFHLRNGQSLKDLKQLYSAIRGMDREEFSHHTNAEKNDFANWIGHVLENQKLADRLRSTTDKQETLELIKNELEQS